jgi:transposase
MSRKKRYIKPLNSKEIDALKGGLKSSKGHQFNQRCHAILLSSNGYTVNQLTEIFRVGKNTVYQWFSRYEDEGISGLENKPGRGRKAVLLTDNKEHVKVVEKAVAKVAKKGGNLLAEIEADLDLEQGLSMKILRSFLKRLVTSGNAADGK